MLVGQLDILSSTTLREARLLLAVLKRIILSLSLKAGSDEVGVRHHTELTSTAPPSQGKETISLYALLVPLSPGVTPLQLLNQTNAAAVTTPRDQQREDSRCLLLFDDIDIAVRLLLSKVAGAAAASPSQLNEFFCEFPQHTSQRGGHVTRQSQCCFVSLRVSAKELITHQCFRLAPHFSQRLQSVDLVVTCHVKHLSQASEIQFISAIFIRNKWNDDAAPRRTTVLWRSTLDVERTTELLPRELPLAMKEWDDDSVVWGGDVVENALSSSSRASLSQLSALWEGSSLHALSLHNQEFVPLTGHNAKWGCLQWQQGIRLIEGARNLHRLFRFASNPLGCCCGVSLTEFDRRSEAETASDHPSMCNKLMAHHVRCLRQALPASSLSVDLLVHSVQHASSWLALTAPGMLGVLIEEASACTILSQFTMSTADAALVSPLPVSAPAKNQKKTEYGNLL